MPNTIRAVSGAAFGLAAVLLIVVSAFTYRSLVRSTRASESVEHTYAALSALDDVSARLVDAETGARGYAVTGAERFLEPFDRATATLIPAIDRLAAITIDNPNQQRRVGVLRDQTAAAIGLLRQVVALGRSHQSVPLDLSDREKARMDAVRATLRQMRAEEQRLMEQRSESARLAAATSRAITVGLIAVTVVVLAMSFWFVDRRAMQVRRLTESLSARVRERTAALERAVAEADAANRSKDAFLARVSHELRTPLNAFMGWTRMLRDGHLPPARAADAIAAIDRNAVVLNTLVEDLVDLARINAGKLQISRGPVDLQSVVREAVQVVEPAAQAKSIRVTTAGQEASAIVAGDAVRLRQVFWNLLSNAIKFTPRDGEVALGVRALGPEEVEITVTDSGRGIAEDFLPHVFEPFAQADGTGERGLGLGLAIVQQLVAAHGGRISASSPGVGAGAVFTVVLPLVAAAERA
jgi:signal transduction histidine kinase